MMTFLASNNLLKINAKCTANARSLIDHHTIAHEGRLMMLFEASLALEDLLQRLTAHRQMHQDYCMHSPELTEAGRTR